MRVTPLEAAPAAGGVSRETPTERGSDDGDGSDDSGDSGDSGDSDGGEDGERPRRRRGRRGGRGRRGRGDGAAVASDDTPSDPEAVPSSQDSDGGADAATDARAPRRERGGRPGRSQDRGQDRGAGRGRAGNGGGSSNGRGHSRGREERRSDEPIEGVSDDEAIPVPGSPEELPYAPIEDPADDLDLAGSTLRDILTLLGYADTQITARDPETAGDGMGLIEQIFDIYGDNDETSDELGVLIGRRGETLSSLQYLINTIVSKGGNKPPVFGVDIEGYRRRREEMLVELAKEIAQEVRETGDVITLEPMPAHERRIVHIALREEEGVRTESVGTGEHRQVEILPDD